MTATEELRRMLDERGVKWVPIAWNPKRETFYHAANGVGFCADEYTDGVKIYTDATITPAQAIAATLGRGTCKPMTYDDGYLTDRMEPGEYYEFWEPACACSECGELIPMRRFCPNCGARIVEPTTNDVDAGVSV